MKRMLPNTTRRLPDTADDRGQQPQHAFALRQLAVWMLAVGSFLGLVTAAAAQPVANPQDYTRSSSFVYYGTSDGTKAGLLRMERVEPNNPNQCVETEYSYSDHGHKTGSVTRNCAGASGNASFLPRSSTNGYDGYTVQVNGVPVNVPKGAFASASSNAENHAESRLIDPRFGAVTSLTGPNLLTTRYELDAWGRVERELRADGTSTRSLHCLISGRVSDTASNSAGCGGTGPLSGRSDEVPSGGSNGAGWRAVSYVQVQAFDANNAPMGPAQRTYKDAEGRVIREVVQGFDGPSQSAGHRWIVKDTVYNAYGVAVVTTGTYFLETRSPGTTGSGDMPLTTTVVDALGRPIEVHQRDPKGNASTSFGAYGSHASSRTTIHYGGSISQALLPVPNALATATTNDLGQVRIEEKNANGLLVRVTDPTGAQLAHQHDAFGNLIATKDALQNTISLGYDIRGRKLRMQDPSAGLWTYDYNALGELVWQQSPNQRALSQSTRMAYDRLGRMTGRNAPEYNSSWTYDTCATGKGKLCATATTHGVAKTFTYDALGRPTGSRMAVTNGPSFNTALSYQAGTSRLETQTYPTGLKVQYGYTALGFLNQASLPQAVTVVPDTAPGHAPGPSTTWAAGKVLWSASAVNARGQGEQSLLGNGLKGRTGFDGASGRVAEISMGAGGSVAYHAYVWDSIGNLKSRVDHNGDGRTGAVTDTYSYDALNRLTRYTVEAVNAANLTRTVELHYNAIGNLLYKSDVGNYSYPSFGAGSVRPHAVAQVSMAHETRVYGYDANGNAVSASAGPWRSISYTSFNLPDSNQGAQGPNGLKYTWYYDENQQRIRETRQNGQGSRTTWFLHPDNQGGLGFEVESRSGQTDLNRHYINAGGQLVVVVTRQSLSAYASAGAASPPTVGGVATVKVEFWHKDHLGSLISTSDHLGNVTARYAYDPFGKRRQTSGQYDAHGALVIDWVNGANAGTDRGFTGHEHLDDLGLIHMNGRVFDPTIERFLLPDPLIQAANQLQNYNRYSYCYNNPLVCTDPTGYFSLKKFLGGELMQIAGSIVGGPLGALIWSYGAYTSAREIARTELGYQIGSIAIGILSAYCQGAAAACNGVGQAAWARLAGYSAAQSVRVGAFAAVSTYVNGQIGDKWAGAGARGATPTSIANNTFAHGVWGCASAEVQGGNCKSGATAGLTGAAFSNYGGALHSNNVVVNTMAHAAIGGITSIASGGRFWDGAQSAAFAYLFNHVAHIGINIRVPAWAGKMIWGEDYLGQGGGFGFAVSWPGDVGGEFDVGLYGEVSGSGFDYGTGKASLGFSYERGSLRNGLAGWGKEVSFNDGVGGLSLSFSEDNRINGVGLHVGPGYNIGASVTKTGVLSIRDGIDWLKKSFGPKKQ